MMTAGEQRGMMAVAVTIAIAAVGGVVWTHGAPMVGHFIVGTAACMAIAHIMLQVRQWTFEAGWNEATQTLVTGLVSFALIVGMVFVLTPLIVDDCIALVTVDKGKP